MRTELNIPGQIELNYNETVRVQLTEAGKNRLKEYCRNRELYKAYVERDGRAKFQLWQLMHIFGPMMMFGTDEIPFVRGNIILGEKGEALTIHFEPNSD